MTNDGFYEFYDQLILEEKELLHKKGEDYTDGHDRLSNFKEEGKRLNVSPIQTWAIYAWKHINALEKYVRDGRVASEPVRERVKDLRNYLALGLALIEEEAGEEEKEISSLAEKITGIGNIEPFDWG